MAPALVWALHLHRFEIAHDVALVDLSANSGDDVHDLAGHRSGDLLGALGGRRVRR